MVEVVVQRTRQREIVKIKKASTGEDGQARVMVFARGRVGLQFRLRHHLPAAIRRALDTGAREIFAIAYTDHEGRWSLVGPAPTQEW